MEWEEKCTKFHTNKSANLHAQLWFQLIRGHLNVQFLFIFAWNNRVYFLGKCFYCVFAAKGNWSFILKKQENNLPFSSDTNGVIQMGFAALAETSNERNKTKCNNRVNQQKKNFVFSLLFSIYTRTLTRAVQIS